MAFGSLFFWASAMRLSKSEHQRIPMNCTRESRHFCKAIRPVRTSRRRLHPLRERLAELAENDWAGH